MNLTPCDRLRQKLADWPRLSPTEKRPENRWMLILLAAIAGGVFGQDIANNIIGEVGWHDEFVGLMFALAGGQFGALASRRLWTSGRICAGIFGYA